MAVLFDIRSESRMYSVVSEPNVLSALAPSIRAGVVLADTYFAHRLFEIGINAIPLEANEVTKSLSRLEAVIERMREAGATRDTQLWAVGGGAIQDVAGFVSSIYMRGISWIYIPTTLLGMTDSCIGGKSSINVGQHKNIVGSFHTPTAVLIDTTLTSTLTVEQKMSGLIEAAKICYCRSPDAFDEYLSLDPRSASTPDHFEPIVTLSLRSKKWFVETDEFDRAERLLLNLGHTFGHALESASNFRLSHGMAVGVGILCAVALSGELLTISPRGSVARLVEHIRALLACVPNLSNVLRAIDPPSTLERLKADKKHQTEHYRFVTFDVSGRVHVVRLPKNTETHAKVANALCNTLELLSA